MYSACVSTWPCLQAFCPPELLSSFAAGDLLAEKPELRPQHRAVLWCPAQTRRCPDDGARVYGGAFGTSSKRYSHQVLLSKPCCLDNLHVGRPPLLLSLSMSYCRVATSAARLTKTTLASWSGGFCRHTCLGCLLTMDVLQFGNSRLWCKTAGICGASAWRWTLQRCPALLCTFYALWSPCLCHQSVVGQWSRVDNCCAAFCCRASTFCMRTTSSTPTSRPPTSCWTAAKRLPRLATSGAYCALHERELRQCMVCATTVSTCLLHLSGWRASCNARSTAAATSMRGPLCTPVRSMHQPGLGCCTCGRRSLSQADAAVMWPNSWPLVQRRRCWWAAPAQRSRTSTALASACGSSWWGKSTCALLASLAQGAVLQM